jgi:hypothetical protein
LTLPGLILISGGQANLESGTTTGKNAMQLLQVIVRQRVLATVLAAGLVAGLWAGPAAWALPLDEQIAAARRDWHLGLATERRIADELARYQSAAQASPEVIQLYETYLDRVRRLTEEKRRTLDQLERQQGRQRQSVGQTPVPPAAKSPPDFDPTIPEDQELDALRALDQELNRSLAAFDDEMLREMEQSRIASDLKMQKLAREAAQAAKSLQEQGEMAGSAESDSGMAEGQSSDGSGNETGTRQENREGAYRSADGTTGEKDQGSNQASTGEGQDLAKNQGPNRESGSGQAGPPEDGAANTQDDDIVARQLREAAENETDPELKAKLWKEYHDYKKTL